MSIEKQIQSFPQAFPTGQFYGMTLRENAMLAERQKGGKETL